MCKYNLQRFYKKQAKFVFSLYSYKFFVKTLNFYSSWSHSFSHAYFILDQTPTPTRFLHMGNQLGLFDELNPFDREFKTAQKDVNYIFFLRLGVRLLTAQYILLLVFCDRKLYCVMYNIFVFTTSQLSIKLQSNGQLVSLTSFMR